MKFQETDCGSRSAVVARIHCEVVAFALLVVSDAAEQTPTDLHPCPGMDQNDLSLYCFMQNNTGRKDK
jgi:hypothetical protein